MWHLILRALGAIALTLLVSAPAWAWPAFTVADIEIEGNRRISTGTVLNYLPVRTGETFSPADARRAIRALYDTGLFEDIELARDDGTLIVRVEERPAIAEVNIEGNFSMDEEMLRESLATIGLDRGRTFDRSLLSRVEQELRRQLYSRGKYGMEMEVDVRELERNRAAIDITIREGKTARIRQIKIIGNEIYSDETLKELMESGIPSALSLMSSADEYSRAKLQGDLEEIRSYYLNRGFAQFTIESSQVTITPDKKDIYITIVVDEGERFYIGDIALSGQFPVARSLLREQLRMRSGDIFSRQEVTASQTAMTDRLAEAGYAFARIQVIPSINETNHTVDLEYIVHPGERVHVRRITFTGQSATQDQVYRREMRQFEGAPYSPDKVERSKIRLQRLPQVRTVRVEMERVPGSDSLVDINYALTERRTGSLSVSAGYSSSQGVVFSIGLSQKNLMGTGKDLTIRLNNSESTEEIVLRYTDPYYTDWGVSRSLRLSYRETDPDDILDTADFFSDTAEIGIGYGIPLSEYSRLSAGIGFEGTRIRTTESTPDEIGEFIDLHGNEFGFLEGRLGYSIDTRNRTIFAERGALNQISLEAALPGSDLEFYTLDYHFEGYVPLAEHLVGSFSAGIGYGAGYGEVEDLPFFRHYYAGGIRSVRGYEGASLGPRYCEDGEVEPDCTGDARGGDFRTVGTLELIFPPPMNPESGSTRLSLFYDFGNVFADADAFEANELRSAVGISLNWRSPIGPLSFSFANAIDPEPGDETQSFQFTIGTLF